MTMHAIELGRRRGHAIEAASLLLTAADLLDRDAARLNVMASEWPDFLAPALLKQAQAISDDAETLREMVRSATGADASVSGEAA